MKMYIAKGYECWRDFLEEIAVHFQEQGDVITAKRNVIKVMEHEGEKIVVKSFKIPNILNQFAYRYIRDSKAKRSFLNAQKLQQLGVNTPTPISYHEEFTPWLKESFYICAYFDYDFEIRDVLADNHFLDREAILDAFVVFSYGLHEKGVYHIDYSPGNVLIKKVDDVYHFTIVDVNRMKFLTFDDDLRFKNLSRFSASDTDTTYIAKAYGKLLGLDEREAIAKLFFYHGKHQKYLADKKRVKALRRR